MSTSLLYHMFGIRGYEYRKTDFFKGRACFTIEQPRERYRCSECGSAAGSCPFSENDLGSSAAFRVIFSETGAAARGSFS